MTGGPVPPGDVGGEESGVTYDGVLPPGDIASPSATSSVQPRRTTLLDLIMGQ